MNRIKFVEDTINMLTEQGCYAYSGGSCQYRTPTGKKCAIGLHIPDEMYNGRMQGGVSTLFYCYPEVKTHIESKYGVIAGHDTGFLATLQQRLHDNRAISGSPLPTLEDAKEALKDYLV